jgi:hypothetical protein
MDWDANVLTATLSLITFSVVVVVVDDDDDDKYNNNNG